MTSTVDVIRLVGGPPKLDGSLCDLRVSDRDRADATGGRFVRAVQGSSVTALSSLQQRCRDRASAYELASSWSALVYRSSRARAPRRRPLVYRYDGRFELAPRRAEDGRWGLAVCERTSGRPPLAALMTERWTTLEAALDDASGRFATVAALVPGGLHHDRVDEAQRAVATCVADAARLCAVGAAISSTGEDPQASALAARIARLVDSIDAATRELVDLHLQLDRTLDPAEPVARLGASWAELPR